MIRISGKRKPQCPDVSKHSDFCCGGDIFHILFSTFNNWTIVFRDAVISGGVADGTALINSNLYDRGVH